MSTTLQERPMEQQVEIQANPSIRDIPLWLGIVAAILPTIIHGSFVALVPDAHNRWFAGEFGFIELLTDVVGIAAIVYAALLAFRPPTDQVRKFRPFFLLAVLGMVYFVGEEMSWGQHFFGWATPENWPTIQRQHETNLHNFKESWLLNNLPRAIASIAILSSLIGGYLGGRKSKKAGDIAILAMTAVAMPAAIMTLLPPLVFKLTGVGLPEPGETEELYMTFTALFFFASIWFRSKQISASSN